MKKRILISYAVIVGIFCHSVFGQGQAVGKLKIGDTVPDMPFKIWEGGNSKVVRLSDFRGKLVILDFWGVHCGSCIAVMPRLMKLQNEYTDKIKIIFVTADDSEKVMRLWPRIAHNVPRDVIVAAHSMSFVMSDSVFRSYFPHRSEPLHVWIDRNGIYKEIAYTNTTTPGNINAFFEGKPVSLAKMRRLDMGDEGANVLVGNKDALGRSSIFSSVVFPRIEVGGGGGSSEDKMFDSGTGSLVGFKTLNSSLFGLYAMAYQNSIGDLGENKIVLDGISHRTFFGPRSEDSLWYSWADSNTFCYSMSVPVGDSGRVYPLLRENLDNIFDLQSRIEYRMVKCLIFRRRTEPGRGVTADGNLNSALEYNSKVTFDTLVNMATDNIYSHVERLLEPLSGTMYFVNDVPFERNLNMILPDYRSRDFVSVASLRKALRPKGLDLVEEYRRMKILYIKSKS
jgi:thiol-disulfide isomerase/thioredoxin